MNLRVFGYKKYNNFGSLFIEPLKDTSQIKKSREKVDILDEEVIFIVKNDIMYNK